MSLTYFLGELLDGCLIPKTRFKEKIVVTMDVQTGETVEFFSIDNQKNKDCKFNQKSGGGRVCDLLVYYKKTDTRIGLVEIKGNMINDAVEQIVETKKKIINKAHNVNFIWIAIIISHGSAPIPKSEDIKKKLGDMEVYIRHVKKSLNIGRCIRG